MRERPTVVLIGAGGFGIRHLEGLLKAKTSLAITVVDASPEARERAKAICDESGSRHACSFSDTVPHARRVDVAIVATTSATRADAVRTLLKNAQTVKYLLLEKILFNKKADYAAIDKLLKKRKVRAWVNSPLSQFPFHGKLGKKVSGAVHCHIVAGERYGLMTNIVHYAHYAAYLAKSAPVSADASLITPKLIEGKRRGSYELFGTLTLRFKNDSALIATALPMEHPRRTFIASKRLRASIDDTTGTAQLSEQSGKWKWTERPAPFTRQSDMTGIVVDTLLKRGTCSLPTYAESAKLHLVILEPVRRLLQKTKTAKGLRDFPFT